MEFGFYFQGYGQDFSPVDMVKDNILGFVSTMIVDKQANIIILKEVASNYSPFVYAELLRYTENGKNKAESDVFILDCRVIEKMHKDCRNKVKDWVMPYCALIATSLFVQLRRYFHLNYMKNLPLLPETIIDEIAKINPGTAFVLKQQLRQRAKDLNHIDWALLVDSRIVSTLIMSTDPYFNRGCQLDIENAVKLLTTNYGRWLLQDGDACMARLAKAFA